ncbi:MAG: VOC family protein [Pseudomonadota bacterium]|nr:VOC family protein [Pseudomonadota bacterium]
MIDIRARETVILAAGFSELVAWYRDVLGFSVVNLFEDGFHYCNLETPSGIKIGIADAQEMGVVPGDRRNNTVVLQFEVDDVRELFAHLKQTGASITNEPTFNKQDGFWFGAFADPEGNPYWVVDKNCP